MKEYLSASNVTNNLMMQSAQATAPAEPNIAQAWIALASMTQDLTEQALMLHERLFGSTAEVLYTPRNGKEHVGQVDSLRDQMHDAYSKLSAVKVVLNRIGREFD